MQPTLALLGRANVGKSTLFNRLTQTRDAIVADFAGLTRDRHYGKARLGAQECIVIDTGGLEPPEAGNGILQHMARQTQQAAMEADVLIFVLDARQGLCAQDQEIARWLRRLGKPCLLAANKAEGMAPGAPQLAEFFELGLGEVLPLSAAHGQGVRTLAEQALALLAPTEELPDADEADEADEGAQAGQRPIRLAVAGRPNVGKSTLINTWLGEERLVAFDQPGTTRDTIRVPFEHQGQKFELMDTAGLRRKGRVFEAVEKFSLIKTLQAIEGANVVVLLIDALEGVTDQDAHIAGFILESGRGVVLAVNKCDALDGYQRQMLERSLQLRLAFLPFAPPHFISAQKRQGLQALWRGIFQAQQCATCKMPTPVLTRVLLESVQLQAPKKTGNRRPKLRYAHQGGMNPPRIIIHGNNLEHITQAYKRFLEGRFRKQFNIVGTPLFIEMKSSQNPYADRR